MSTSDEQEIEFLYDSLESLRTFPAAARSRIGHALHQLQLGGQPVDMKPMKTVGAGVYEVRVAADGRAFRAFYVAKFKGVIYVLHAFEKKSRTTPKKDIDLGSTRYRELVRARGGP